MGMFFSYDEYCRTVHQVDVSLAGKTYTSNQLPSRNIDLNAARSSTNTSVREIPEVFGDGKARPAWADVVYNGRRIRYTTGFVGPFGVQMTSRTPSIVDVLWKLARSPKEACGSGATPLVFENTPYKDALLMVLYAAGVTDDEIDLGSFNLLDDVDPTITSICTIKPLCVDVTQNLDSIWQELLAFLGLACFVLPGSGKIHLVKKDARPVANPSLKFSNQESDLDSGAYAILDPGLDRQIGGFEDVVTVFTASGPPLSIDEMGMSGDEEDPESIDWIDPDISAIALEPVKATWRVINEEIMESGIAPEEYDGKAAQMSNQYIQTVPQAEWVAEREGRLACRVEHQYNVPVAFDPGLLPGMSAQFRMPEVGFDEWQPGYILSAQSDGLRTNLMVSMGPSEVDGYQVGCPPIADFSILIDAERVVISGNEAVRYFVKVDATTSTDCDGEIVGYDWAVTGATPLTMDEFGVEVAATIPSDAVTMIVLDTIEGVSITLTVIDNNDSIQNQDSLTQSLAGPLVEIRTRVLSKADHNGGTDGTWSVVSNPNAGWKRYTRSGVACLAVPKYNTSGPLASIWADGKIFITEDYLLTEPTVEYSTLPGTSSLLGACFFVNEDDDQDWLIGTHEGDGTGKLWRSLDGGLTWGNGVDQVGTPVRTLSQPVLDCELGNEMGTGYIRVVVGNTIQHSFSNGITWETVATGAGGTTGEAFASADWGAGGRHLTVFTGGANVDDATRFDNGETPTIDWSGVVSPPTELRAVTPGLMAPGKFVTVTPDGQIYILNDNAGNYTAAAGPIHTTSYQVVRDGIFPDLNFIAAEPAAKLANDATLYRIDQDTWRSRKIGYGDIITPQRIAAGPFSVWLFEEVGIAERLDSTDNGNHLSLVLSTWKPSESEPYISSFLPIDGVREGIGRHNRGLNIDGSQTTVGVEWLSFELQSQSWYVSFWFWPNRYGLKDELNNDITHYYWARISSLWLYYDADKEEFTALVGSSRIDVPMPMYEWSHVAIWYDQNAYEMHLSIDNGVPVSTTGGSLPNGGVVIGQNAYTPNRWNTSQPQPAGNMITWALTQHPNLSLQNLQSGVLIGPDSLFLNEPGGDYWVDWSLASADIAAAAIAVKHNRHERWVMHPGILDVVWGATKVKVWKVSGSSTTKIVWNVHHHFYTQSLENHTSEATALDVTYCDNFAIGEDDGVPFTVMLKVDFDDGIPPTFNVGYLDNLVVGALLPTEAQRTAVYEAGSYNSIADALSL